MDSSEIKAICDERLGKWTQRLVDEHATPVIVVGVGHDHRNGALVVITLEEMDDQQLLLFLHGAAEHLEKRVIKQWGIR